MRKHRDRAIHKGEEYVRSYPCLQKWIKQCVQCQARGYDPDYMPDSVGHNPNWFPECGKYTARWIRKWFKPLILNDRGLCEVCELYDGRY